MKKLKVKVYIDGANMFYAQKKLGWMVDWKKVREMFKKDYAVQEFRFYMAKRDNDIKMENFFETLERIGFKIFSKPVKRIKTRTGREEEKANFDVEITRDILLDILWFKKKWEGVIFLSGDSDFAPLFWDLKRVFSQKIFVFSSRKTLSWELRLAATNYFFWEEIKDKVFRKNWALTRQARSVKLETSNRRSS